MSDHTTGHVAAAAHARLGKLLAGSTRVAPIGGASAGGLAAEAHARLGKLVQGTPRSSL